MQLVATLDEYGKPAWITAMIVGFLLWWPIGLGILAYLMATRYLPIISHQTKTADVR